jgi:hypothetical protein
MGQNNCVTDPIELDFWITFLREKRFLTLAEAPERLTIFRVVFFVLFYHFWSKVKGSSIDCSCFSSSLEKDPTKEDEVQGMSI